jgi:hypothetical protein
VGGPRRRRHRLSGFVIAFTSAGRLTIAEPPPDRALHAIGRQKLMHSNHDPVDLIEA